MKLGVLLMNTGTADEPTEQAISAYLREFMMDQAIIGAPAFIRKMIAAYVSATRPKHTVENYRAFWTPEGSPFMIACKAQRAALEKKLVDSIGNGTMVVLAMRYGNPSIAKALDELQEAGCDTVVLLPSYPQEAKVCAGTCLAQAQRQLERLRDKGWRPRVVKIAHFHDHQAYERALAQNVADRWTHRPGAKLVVSFHSTLLKDIENGDPYRLQTHETAFGLARSLGVPESDLVLSYQSRFDSRKWLGPFTEPMVLALAKSGVKDICVVCPGFTAENLETAIEIDGNLRSLFMRAAGDGARFTYVPALNAAPGLIAAMEAAICQGVQR